MQKVWVYRPGFAMTAGFFLRLSFRSGGVDLQVCRLRGSPTPPGIEDFGNRQAGDLPHYQRNENPCRALSEPFPEISSSLMAFPFQSKTF